MKQFFLAAALALGALGSLSPSHAAEGKVVIALKPDKNPEKMLEERTSLSTFLSQALGGKKVEVVVPLSSAVIVEGFANGTIDLGYLSATDLINARKAKVADLLLVGEIDGKKSYTSYWLALKEKSYTSIADLKGKPIAFASRTSTSGFVIPLWDLKTKGLIEKPDPESFFGAGNVFYGTGYVSAVERVLNGEAEAAAVSFYVLDRDKHLNEEQRSRLKKIAEQGPVPTHVIAVRSTVSAEEREKLQKALESLNEPENHALRDSLFTSRLVPSNAEEHLSNLQGAIDFLESGRK